jgi:hypothetical protein
MPPRKQTTSADFGDILSSFDRRMTEEAPAPVRRARRAESEGESEPVEEPRPKNRLRRLLGNISLPWTTGIGALIGGFGPRPLAPYAEESAEAETASPVEPPLSESGKPEAAKPETAKVEQPKTEDQAIAEELGLSPDLATVDLQRLRRDFAKKNHPDRFEPARRTNAARRMSIANMLIDEQMRQNRSPR